VIYVNSAGEWDDLYQIYLANLIQAKDDLDAEGTPDRYMILGNSSDVIQMKLYDTPDEAGTVYVYYLPNLTNLTTSTDEDVILQKYPNTVIKFATAFAFQFFKKDAANFDKWFLLGTGDISDIRQRELSADSYMKELPEALLRARRMSRHTK